MSVLLNILTKYDETGMKKATSGLKDFSKGLKTVAGAVGIGVGLSALTSGLMNAGKAAVEDVKSQALLAGQLRNTIGANDAQISGIEKAIKAMQLQTAIADDELRPALAGLVRATGDANKAQELLALSADIAAGTGKDLASVSAAVGKAAAGQTTALTRLVPSLKGARDWAEAAKQQFAGMAETAAKNDPFKQLEIIFGELQEQIGMALLPYLQDFVAYLQSDMGQSQLSAIVDFFVNATIAAGNLVGFIVENRVALGVLAIGIGAATIAWGIYTAAMAIMTAGTVTATIAVQALKTALISTGVGAILVALGTVAAGFLSTADAANTATTAVTNYGAAIQGGGKPGDPNFIGPISQQQYDESHIKPGTTMDKFENGQWWTLTWDGKKWNKKPFKEAKTPGNPIKNPVADFYANMADEIKKQNARLRLESMGASNALIESIIGGGDDWFKVYKDAIKGGEVGLAALQSKFNQTKAGLAEIADAEKALADAAAEAEAKIAEQTQTFIENQNAQRDAIAATLENVRALGAYRKEMGEFEQAATDAFASVQESLAESFKTGAITKSAYDNLVSYAASEASILISIGKQRDALAAKKSLVESVIADVKDAVIGTAKLGDFVKTEAQTITQTVTKMVGGIAFTTTQTTEVLKTNATLVDGFKAVLAKTRTFVSQLKELRALGLTGDLFKQIVDAGTESGGATAAAIIAGGASTVSELNNLYGQIQTEAGKAAEVTAQTLYGSGIDLTNGIIAGIQSQENALISVASDLGNKFADAFATKVGAAITNALAIFKNGGIEPVITTPGFDTGTGAGMTFTGVGTGGYGGTMRVASVSTANQVPVQVNLTLDSKVVAQSLIRLERTSGAIWQRAQ